MSGSKQNLDTESWQGSNLGDVMSLDVAQLDALMARDSATAAGKISHGNRELALGAFAYNSGPTHGPNAAPPYSGNVTSSHWGGAACQAGGPASYSSGAAYQSSVRFPPAADDFSLGRTALPGRRAVGLTRSVPSLHGKRHKPQPRNTDATWDVETLQELVITYKRKVVELEKGRRLLRSQNQKAQERVVAKDREIDTILQKVAGGVTLITEKSMIRTLKRQVRVLQDSLAEKCTELDRLRGTMKFTQVRTYHFIKSSLVSFYGHFTLCCLSLSSDNEMNPAGRDANVLR